MYTNIDQTLVHSLHGLSNCEISGLECHVITTEYRKLVYGIHIFCNALVHVIYSRVSGQCSHTIYIFKHYVTITFPLLLFI